MVTAMMETTVPPIAKHKMAHVVMALNKILKSVKMEIHLQTLVSTATQQDVLSVMLFADMLQGVSLTVETILLIILTAKSAMMETQTETMENVQLTA